MRLALMATCLADGYAPRVARATTVLLERLGHQVVFPRAQTCCGQMHVNTGFQKEALGLVEHHVEVFARALETCDAVVAPSGSCVGSVRHQHAMLAERAGRSGLAARAARVAGHTYELSELLVDVLGVSDVGAYYPHTVTYHPTCHSLRMLRVGGRPLALLRAVDGLELVELTDADQCCGFGGTFALKNSATSAAMLADKVGHIEQSGASRCAVGDASCQLHIEGGLRRDDSTVHTVHLAEVLAGTRTEPFR